MTVFDRLDRGMTAVTGVCPLAAFGWTCVLAGSLMLGASATAGTALYVWKDIL